MATFTMKRGDTPTFEITITDENGAVNLTGKTLTFTAKKTLSGTALFSKTLTVTDAVAGIAEVKLASGDTSTLPNYLTKLYYDVQLASGTDRYTVVSGTLTVEPDVTVG